MRYNLPKTAFLLKIAKAAMNQLVILLLVTSTIYAKSSKESTTKISALKNANLTNAPLINIKGKITDKATGESLIGATVVIKNTQLAVTTDVNGNYSFNNVDNNATLVITYVGYQTTEVAVNGKTVIDIQLQPSANGLSEVVVVGYGTQKKTSTTAAVSTVDLTEIRQKPVVNITNSLIGRVSGVIARQGTGEPGQDGSTFTIRGAATTGRTGALTIVDGVPRDFSRLDPNSIATITILKDAAAVAPYGVAGANGVVVITTKQGKTGKPVLSYNGYYGVQNPTRTPKFVDAVQYAKLVNEAAINDKPTDTPPAKLPFSDRDIELYGNGLDPDGHANAHPLDGIIRKNNPIQYHNFTLTGGTEDVKYFASFGYNRQDGMWSTTFLNKFNGSLGLTVNATKSTTVDIKVNGYQEDQHYPSVGAGSIFRQAYRQTPTTPVLYSNGLAAGYIGQSLYGEIYNSGYEIDKNNSLLTQISINQKLPIKGLSIKGVLSYDKGPDPLNFSPVQNSTVRIHTLPASLTSPQLPAPTAAVPAPVYGPGVAYTFPLSYQGQTTTTQKSNVNNMATYQGMLNYAGTFGKSEITGLFVTEYRNVNWEYFQAARINYSLSLEDLDFGGTVPSNSTVNGLSGGQKQLGYVYRFTYGYAGKYFAEAAGRYDGSYVFAPGHRFGFFPAFSAAWRISEEDFMKNISWINNLKLRTSYGVSGNYPNIRNGLDRLGDQYNSLDQFGVNGASGVIGNGITQGIAENLQGNPAITWETAKKFDVGVEGTFWNGILGIEADYFYENRSNFLVDQTGVLPKEYGVTLGQVNGGKLSNKGIDLTISSFKQFSNDLRLDIRGTFTYAKSKVVQKFELASTYNNPNRRETGRPLGEQFGLQSLGYYTSNDFVDPTLHSLTLKPGVPVPNYGPVKPGDIKYADINGPANDGKPDGKVDANDQTDIGFPVVPQIIYSLEPHLTFKNFDLDLLFQGTGRSSLILNGFFAFPFSETGSVTELAYSNHWTPNNPNALYPRIGSAPTSNNREPSTHFLRNTSYLRLRSAEFGYTFSHKLLGNAFKALRIYTSGQNLFTWTPYMKEFVDPENSANAETYYQQRVITIGVNATF
ncbi:SusC/RagA family TonB-linked outer membrane protein [Mucilaginibacter sp. UYCu711]|uniref:SusC/RagA family TonB-linked outer membrane protein n=1 Tax=Mucilaginibacter sp. UYCu711 TaxID=3156339 RepID=UPI003D1C36E4